MLRNAVAASMSMLFIDFHALGTAGPQMIPATGQLAVRIFKGI